jgi:hypothetical protein
MNGSLTGSLAESEKQILVDPGNEMVFKDTFDYLMQKVGRENFVNVRAGEVEREGLSIPSVSFASRVRSRQDVL